MSILFGKLFCDWIERKTGVRLEERFEEVLNNHSLELVRILKREEENPELLAQKITSLMRKHLNSGEEIDMEAEIVKIIDSFEQQKEEQS